MKVLLVEHPRGQSAIHLNDVANTPLSSCLMSGYVASLLHKNGIETEILDLYSDKYSYSQMVQEVIKRECDIIGIHLVYSWEHTPKVLNTIDEIRSHIGIPIIVYGFYPTFAYESILKFHPSINYLIIGEPEMTFLELFSLLKQGRDVNGINGLAFRNGGEIIANKRRKIIENLDSLPFPFRAEEHLGNNGGNILGSRGCYGNCTFCYINNFYGKRCKWRGRTPENIYREVKSILRKLSRKYVYFIDANFFGPGEEEQGRAEKIAEFLQSERGLRFGLECRVNDVQEKSLKALAHAGLQDVFLGVESGSKRSLRRMHKGTTVEQAVRAIKMLRKYGIEPYCGFIMFEPDSTLQDLRDNFNFLKSNNLLNRLETTVDLLYHPQIILMGTESYINLKKMNRIKLSPHSSYQGTFICNDNSVIFLAEVMSSVCRYLLTLMDRSDSPIYWRRCFLNTNHFSHEITNWLNQWLVEFFNELLMRLECGEITCDDDSKDFYLNNSINSINSSIRLKSNSGDQPSC
jgi:radical SAM superfamily enzyme YgiQ (UPF0313 family)